MRKSVYIVNNQNLMSEWNWEKNNALGFSPDSISSGSNLKVWWKCKLGHEWEASVVKRVAGRNCPYCANKKILIGFNDLATTHPLIAASWAFDKNGDLTPQKVTHGSNLKVWWRCSFEHYYVAAISDRCSRNTDCPYCSNKKIIVGYNDLATTNSQLAEEWNWERNVNTKPQNISSGSNKIVWWKCKVCGFEWKTSPNNRTNRKTGCPVCAHKTVLSGYNDLATIYPQIAARWDLKLNKKLPSEVSPKSSQYAWWKCEKDERHIFRDRINHMTMDNIKCPICSNQKIIPGINDLPTTHPNLMQEWNFEKNTIDPSTVTYGKNKKVWWKCREGHSWQATIASRAGRQKTGCPICSLPLRMSRPEKAIAYYLSKYFVIETNKKIFEHKTNAELDIFLPELNLAVEYDGEHWHKNIERDLEKDEYCHKHGICLIRIREHACPAYQSTAIFITLSKQIKELIELEPTIKQLFRVIFERYDISLNLDIDLRRDYNDIIGDVVNARLGKSIASTNLIDEWDYEKNANIKPESVSVGTQEKYWWKCKKGHSWRAAAYSRSGKQKCGCPYCSNQKLLVGYNDLQTVFPEIARDWDCENSVKPCDVVFGTNKKYWWKCKKCGTKWFAAVSARTKGKRGCPQCGRQATKESHYKKVKNLDTGEEFASAIEAGYKYNISAACIRNSCTGRTKSAGGYKWNYI